MNEDSVHPFEVFYDPDTEGYYIFAPTGCVLVGGVAATIANQDANQNVPLTALSSSFPTALYAHVTESTSGGATVNTVTFDGNATLSGAKYDFKVCSFGADEFDGNQYDLCTSVVNLGGEGGGETYTPPPQPFDLEITEEGGTPDIHVVRRYIPAPETVYEDTTERYFSAYANIYLNVVRYNSAYYISVSQTQGASNATSASWLLWEWDSTNNVFIDRRPKILPLYDL